jgi:lipopolysaccharide assembly outer membrane protein LptD (OstA)
MLFVFNRIYGTFRRIGAGVPPMIPRRIPPACVWLLLIAAAFPSQAQGPAESGRPRIVEAEDVNAPEAPAEEAAKEKEEEAKPAITRRFRTAPFQGGEVRAPSLNRRVSASPDDPFASNDPNEIAAFPTEFGSAEYGFVMPDMKEPFRDIQADAMEQGIDTNQITLNGNVRLRLGDMYFQSDAFHYAQDLGQVGAEGNVLITQRNSTLKALKLNYTLPSAEELPKPTLLEPLPTADEIEAKRLKMGRVQATDLHIIEPTREIMADQLDYDLLSDNGEILRARGKAGMYYFYAEKMIMTGPNSFEAEDVWLTTCECDFDDPDNPPPYRIKLKHVTIRDGKFIKGTRARLQLGNMNTPLFLPILRQQDDQAPWTIDFDTGSRAELGSFLNVGQQFRVNDDVHLGPRLYVTQKEGVGFGADMNYDFTETPSSRLFLNKGEFHSLMTTENRGYVHWYNKYRYSEDLVVKMQLEHWSDSGFYRDFYYPQYKNRTTPRSFATVAYRQEAYVATATARVDTHGWVRETERLPEASFHVPDRSIADRLYLSFDTVMGYNNREPEGVHGGRGIALTRLTYDMDPLSGLSLTPFAEFSGSYYTDTILDNDSDGWASALVGITGQTRLQRTYGGALGFSAFKHIIVPSITLSHRPDSSVDLRDIPFYDSWDSVSGRTRIESKLDNIVLGKDAETGEVWQVGRLTLYQGNDFWNEVSQTEDYEIELDVRPRPWWGMQVVGESHNTSDEFDLDDPFAVEEFIAGQYERITGRPIDELELFDLNTQYSDYDRVLAQVYYDGTQLGSRYNARLGFSYTQTRDRVFNREVLYGMGYRLSDQWSMAFEHRYDFEDNDLRTQTYEIRRIWDCWETAIRFEDRERGFDINFEIALTALPGTKLKL